MSTDPPPRARARLAQRRVADVADEPVRLSLDPPPRFPPISAVDPGLALGCSHHCSQNKRMNALTTVVACIQTSRRRSQRRWRRTVRASVPSFGRSLASMLVATPLIRAHLPGVAGGVASSPNDDGRTPHIRAGSGQHGAHRRREHGEQPMTHPAGLARVADHRQRDQQIRRGRPVGGEVHHLGYRVASLHEQGDRRRWACGHGSTPGDQAGVGTRMITCAAVPALHHHRRVTAPTHRSARPCRAPVVRTATNDSEEVS